MDALVRGLVDAATRAGLADPFKGGRKAGRTAHAAYLSLWGAAVAELASRSRLGDGHAVDKATAALLGLSASVVRPFRIVATETAARVGTALVEAGTFLGAARERAEVQREAAEAEGAAGRAAAFGAQAAELHRQAGDARAALAAIFQGVAAARFRDVCPEVRATVIAAIGAWVARDPAAHMGDAMLKYLAWALSDRAAPVRAAALDALLALYAVPESRSPLRPFTERFSPRFAELVHDVDDGVAARGVRLVATLVAAGEMGAASVGDAFRLLTDTAPAVREAAAQLVVTLLQPGGEEGAEEGGGGGEAAAGAGAAAGLGGSRRGGRGRASAGASASTPSLPSWSSSAQLKGLLDIMAGLAKPPAFAGGVGEEEEGEEEGAAAAAPPPPLAPGAVDVVVDALASLKAPGSATRPRLKMLTDWAALTAALADDAACEARGEAGTTNVASLLASALRSAAAPSFSASTPAPSRAKAAAAARQALADATAVVGPALPSLFARFQADAGVTASLAACLRWVDLSVYGGGSDGREGLEALLRRVAAALARHTAPPTLRVCARALARCAGPDGPGAAREAARGVLDEAARAASGAAADAGAALLAGGGGGGRGRGAASAASTVAAAEAAWTRLACLRLVAPPPAGGAAADTAADAAASAAVRLLTEAAGSGAARVPSSVVCCAATSALAGLLWRLHAVEAAAAGDGGGEAAPVAASARGRGRRGSGAAAAAPPTPTNPALAAAAALARDAATLATALAEATSGAADPAARAGAAAALADLILAFSPAALEAGVHAVGGGVEAGAGAGAAGAAPPAHAVSLAAAEARAAAVYRPPEGVINALMAHCDAALSAGGGGAGATEEEEGQGGVAAVGAAPAPAEARAEAAALTLARLLAFGALPPDSEPAYLLLSHLAAPDSRAAAIARDGARALRRAGGGGPPPADVWAAALGAAAGRGEAAVTALARALASAPPGSAADAGAELAAALAAVGEEAARAPPPFARAAALRPLAMLAPRVPAPAAVGLASSLRASADRLADRGRGPAASAAAAGAEVMHALADRFADRGAGGDGGGPLPGPRSALARPAAPAPVGDRSRRISFAATRGHEEPEEEEEDDDDVEVVVDAISEDNEPPPARVPHPPRGRAPLTRARPPSQLPGRAGLAASESGSEEEDAGPAVPTAEELPDGDGDSQPVSEPVRRVRQRV